MPDIKTLAKTQNVDLANTFTRTSAKLAEMLSFCDPVPAKAGETLKQYKVTGSLSDESYTEGQKIPLSMYSKTEVQTLEVTLKPYRKQTTLQQIQKRGYAAAVDETDRAMLADMQRDIKKALITTLGKGTLTATGTTLVSCAANAWAVLGNQMEEYSFGDTEPVFFANPIDFAACIGKSEVFSAFGLSYIENWAGLGTLVSTGSVTAGSIFVTAKGNLKVYFIDAHEGDQGFGFYTDETGYIAIQHSAELTDLTYDTVAWTALTPFAEYADLVVKGTIAPEE